MGKASRAKRRQKPTERRGGTSPQNVAQLKRVAGWSVVAVLVLGLGFVFYQNASRSSEADATTAAFAAENAGGPVEIHTGTRHTVYHSSAPLPTPESPTATGQPILVWFSGTWCEFCEHMGPFAHRVANQFADELVFLEKSVDHDRSAAHRYGVRGTPTFVLIDAEGQELDRFGFQRSASEFEARIEAAIASTRG